MAELEKEGIHLRQALEAVEIDRDDLRASRVELRTQLEEANRLLQDVLNDVARCKVNDVVWPSTVRRIREHLAKEGT